MIDPGKLSPYPQHLDRFPGALVVPWAGNETCVDHDLLHEFCKELDIIYSSETAYDIHLPDIAREHHTATVIHVNPEFFRWHNEPLLPPPTVFWLPTSWRADLIPVAHVIPMPVTTIPDIGPRTHASTFIHIAGHKAARDRNGTSAVLGALRRIPKAPVIIRTQSPLPIHGIARAVVQHQNFPTTDDLFADADCLILTRRYGGLCLPQDEALARAIPVIASDRIPERDWLPADTLVPAPIAGVVRTPAGNIPTHNPSPQHIAAIVNRLHIDDELYAKLSSMALEEAQSRSWENLKPLWIEKMNEAVDCARG